MTMTDVADKILEVLGSEKTPITPTSLYDRLKDMHVRESQSRRAVLDLAVEHRIEITSDRKVRLSTLPHPTVKGEPEMGAI